MKINIALLLAALALSGCSSFGGEDKFSATYIRAHIIENKTTESQVKSLYGVPDDQDTNSDGSYRWSYRKNGNLAAMTDVVGYIPGAGMIASALGTANAANGAASAAGRASGKITGETEHHGEYLTIKFDKNKTVTNWWL